jgi:hypothetical protein
MIRWLAHIRRALIVLLFTGILWVPAGECFAQQADSFGNAPADSNRIEIRDENILVLEVRIEKKSTGHGLIAYQHGDETLLPLGEICSILELAVMVNPDQGTAEGWIVTEDRTLSLNLPAQSITTNGNLVPLAAGSAGQDENDIYVLSTLLEQWLPVDLEINLPRMHVKITPRETLPFQSRLKRDEQRSYWMASQGNTSLKYPMQSAPYRLWSWPMVDATFGFMSGRSSTTRRLALESHADLAGLSTNLFISHLGSEDHSQTVARLKAGRWNPAGGLLGPLAATKYELGDLFISRVPLISTSKQGLGVMVSNQSLTRSREFDTTEIQGDAPPGWEAELYINGSLYDFQTIGESGQFFFTDVPLAFGNNIFRTVLYGPRGETREIVKNANISHEMSDVGELKYKAIVVKEGNGLLSTPPARDYLLENAWNQQLELSFALSPKHALVANFSRLKVEGSQEFFSSLTSHNSLGRVYMEAILAKSMRGGKAYSIGARARYLGQNLFAQHKASDNYRAEAYYGHSYITGETILRSSGNMGTIGKSNLFYNFSAINRQFEENILDRENELKFHLSASVGRFLLSHNLRYLMKEYTTNDFQEMLGTQLVRTQMGPLSLRGDLNYEISPSRVRSTGVSVNWFRTDRVQLVMRGSHFLKPAFGNDNMALDMTVFFDKFSLGLNYSFFKMGGSAIGLTLGTSLARDNRSSCFAVQHRRLANRSAASTRAYIDLNANRIFDEGDEPMSGVGFKNLTEWRKVRTNDSGIALLTGLQVHRSQTIEVDLNTVADPFLVPITSGVNVLGHPGSYVEVDFPFSYVGEMEGMVIDGGSVDSPVRHVGLEILDEEGNRVSSTVGEFDGYYYFSEIFPGEYKLGVISSTINTSRFLVPEPVPFLIPPGGGFISGPDIVLERKEVEKVIIPPIAALAPEIEEDEDLAVADLEVVENTIVEMDPVVPEPSDPVMASNRKEAPEDQAKTPVTVQTAALAESSSPISTVGLTDVPEPAKLLVSPDFDEELTLSLIFELLYRNSLWPDAPVQ